MWSRLKEFYCISQTWFSLCQCNQTSHLTSVHSQSLLGLLFFTSFLFIAQGACNILHSAWSEPTSSSLGVQLHTVLLTTHLYRATWVHWGPSHTCPDWRTILSVHTRTRTTVLVCVTTLSTMLLMLGLLDPWRWRQCVPPNFRNHQSDTASQCRRHSNYITPWLIQECHICP